MKTVLYSCLLGACPEVVYECGIGMCPQAVFEPSPAGSTQTPYECGLGACPKAETKDGIVTISHPNEPEKGKVTMTAEEWNAMLRDGKPIEL